MKQKILSNLNDPAALERLYRENRQEFARELADITGENDSELVRFWKIRLASEPATGMKFSLTDLAAVLVIALLTAFLVKLPAMFPGIGENFFFTRDLAIIVFSGVIVYAMRSNRISFRSTLITSALVLAALLCVNLLPDRAGDSLNIAALHAPLFMWCIFGMVYASFDFHDHGKRMAFIRFNGELLTMTGLLLITGGILTGVTIGLFHAIGSNIEKTYMEYIAFPGAAAAPILASYLIGLYPDLTRRIVPVIARVFTPIVLLTLVIYFAFLLTSGIPILEDRNLLLIFNVMLVAVTAIIVFAVTELDKTRNRNFHVMVLLILALVTLLINAIALTAIVTRLMDGLTPNRVVVFSTNLLVFINLILLAKDLFRSWKDASRLESVERTVARYLTVYFFWTAFALFLLPLLFQFR